MRRQIAWVMTGLLLMACGVSTKIPDSDFPAANGGVPSGKYDLATQIDPSGSNCMKFIISRGFETEHTSDIERVKYPSFMDYCPIKRTILSLSKNELGWVFQRPIEPDDRRLKDCRAIYIQKQEYYKEIGSFCFFDSQIYSYSSVDGLWSACEFESAQCGREDKASEKTLPSNG